MPSSRAAPMLEEVAAIQRIADQRSSQSSTVVTGGY
jgi:hypothetical protein